MREDSLQTLTVLRDATWIGQHSEALIKLNEFLTGGEPHDLAVFKALRAYNELALASDCSHDPDDSFGPEVHCLRLAHRLLTVRSRGLSTEAEISDWYAQLRHCVSALTSPLIRVICLYAIGMHLVENRNGGDSTEYASAEQDAEAETRAENDPHAYDDVQQVLEELKAMRTSVASAAEFLLLMASNQFERAEAMVSRINADADSVLPDVAQLWLCIGRGSYTEAACCCSDIQNLASLDSTAPATEFLSCMRALALICAGDPKGVKLMEELCQRPNANPEMKINLVTGLLSQGRTKDAEVLTAKLMEELPEYHPYRRAIEQLNELDVLTITAAAADEAPKVEEPRLEDLF